MGATVSYRTEFEASYLQNCELHSHRYRVEVTVDGPQRHENKGKVIEFKHLADYVNQVCYDGYFLYGTDVLPAERPVIDALNNAKVKTWPCSFPLSVENFCIDIADRLQLLLNRFDPGVRVLEVKLRETNDSFATWTVQA